MYLFTYSGPRLRLLTGCDSGCNHYYITLWPGQQVCIVSNINTIPPTLNKIIMDTQWKYFLDDGMGHCKKGVFSYNLWRHPNIIWHTPGRLYLWFVTEIKKKGPNKTKGVENVLCSLNIFPTAVTMGRWICLFLSPLLITLSITVRRIFFPFRLEN